MKLNDFDILRPAGFAAAPEAGPVRVIGIDLGTTNSTVAEILWQPGRPGEITIRCLEVDQPTSAGIYTNTLVPSIVAIDGEKTLVYHGERGDHARQEKFYRQAADASPGDGVALFNLALAKRKRGEFDEARTIIAESLQRERLGPSLTLAAQLEEVRKNQNERKRLLAEATQTMSLLSAQGEWELGWLITAAQMSGDKELEAAAARELKKRKSGREGVAAETGNLPEVQK